MLGSAAGGGFPQWNCNCPNCAALRSGTLAGRARTQSSLAIRGQDPGRWVLINASPDVLSQLAASPELQPTRSPRDSRLCAVVLCDGQVDHTTGLFMLRESAAPWPIYCTANVQKDLSVGNPIFKVLEHFCGTDHHLVEPDKPFSVAGLPTVQWQAVAVAGKPAPYSPNRAAPLKGDNIALFLEDAAGGSLFYAPGIAGIDDSIWPFMMKADCVLVDGTFWSDDEMPALKISSKRARDLGHLPQSGAGGMLEWLDKLPKRTRKILIHINNTNPILDESSPQAQEVRRRGVEVAHDGLEIDL